VQNKKALTQWLSYIESQHDSAIDLSLSRVKTVWNRLDLDLSGIRVVSIAGTNGKGTTTACIEALLNAAGCTVGVYSSPHMQIFNERIKVQSKMAPDRDICDAFQQIEDARSTISLTYFEFATLAALSIFAKNNVDVILLEVGLGGRLDATNIIDADISVITSIGYDHQDYLGDTLEQIANEKAGIIKSTSEVVFGIVPSEFGLNESVLQENRTTIVPNMSEVDHATGRVSLHNDLDSELSQNLTFNIDNSQVPFQNIPIAFACFLHLIQKLPSHSDSMRTIMKDKQKVEAITNKVSLPGRYQQIATQPKIILDVAHNAQATRYLCARLKQETYEQIFIVVAMMTDKNIEASLSELLLLNAAWICCDSVPPRGENSERLGLFLQNNNQHVVRFTSVEKGTQYAIEQANNEDMICVCGSFVTVACASNTLKQL